MRRSAATSAARPRSGGVRIKPAGQGYEQPIAEEVVDAFFFFSSRRRHTRFDCDWSSDVCSSDLGGVWQRSTPMSMSHRAQRMALHHLRHRADAQLNLIPLIDILSVMVAFLLVYSKIGRASCRERV